MDTSSKVFTEKQGHVGIVNFQAQKLNVLSHTLRLELYNAIQQFLSDVDVESIVLVGSNQTFSVGADVKEFSVGTHLQFPSLHDLIYLLSDANKPTIAAITGAALGGGLELALACHHRVIHAQAQLALPEVHLGVLPGAGGTQLLARYIGVTEAFNAIRSGKPLKLNTLKDSRLIDVLTDLDVKKVAVEFAGTVKKTCHIKSTQINASSEVLAELNAKRQAVGDHPQHVVQHAILDAIEAAATLDFEQGFAQEQALFNRLISSDVSKSLRHAFFAERELKHIPNLDTNTATQVVKNVAIIGAGTMGSGITICFLQAGYSVILIDNKQANLDRGLGLIQTYFAGQVTKGHITEDQSHAIQSHLKTSLEYADLAYADLALEAVFEDVNIKTAVLKQMDMHLPAHAILASNTSTLDLNELAAQTSRAESVVGLHFFSPAQVMPLLEVIRTKYTSDSTLLTALDISKKLAKVAVVAGVCDGFIGNRMVNEYLRIAGLMIDAGASPYQIDHALENWGMAMGPFRMCDMAGNDIGYQIRQQQLKVNPHKKFSGLPDQLFEANRFGQKTRKGWYDYTKGNRRGDQDPDVLSLIDAYRAKKGIVGRNFTDAEIVARCIYALANEGFRLLEEGIALRQSDIDVVYLAGYGFPRWRGGPMYYATQQNLENMIQAMEVFAQDPYTDAEFWQAPALLSQLAA